MRPHEFPDRAAADTCLSALLEGALRQQIAATGGAVLLLSGGRTPVALYRQLAEAELDWSRVDIGLVDERWVAETDPASNARLIRAALAERPAAAARFHPMYTGDPTPDAAVDAVAARYAPMMERAPVVLLGVGTDGHVASWFPRAVGCDRAMDPDTPACVAAINAAGSPVAGRTPRRLTLTASALSGAGLAVLYATGGEKRPLLASEPDGDLPVYHAARLLGSRLYPVWAP